MVVFGLILLILAVAVLAYMWLATAGMDPLVIDYGFLNVELSPLWLFLAGGITLAVLTSGVWLIAVGTRNSARRAREMRELRRQAKEADRRSERDRDRAALGRRDQDHRDGTSPADPRRSGHGRDTTTSPSSGTTAGAGGSGTGEAPILPRPASQGRRINPDGTDAPGTGPGTTER